VPRPKPDSDRITSQLIAEAERMLVETQGRRLVLSEIAARVGISQSYAHRFFPTKADLVRALAQRWFDAVEAESTRILALDRPAAERLELWVLSVLRLKRDRFDADPALFLAYLDLAADHMDLVAQHTGKLSAALRAILADMVPAEDLDRAHAMVEDATVLFRMPMNIARFRRNATDERARNVLRALIGHLG
jgi:AcrR family transcriptional regulator